MLYVEQAGASLRFLQPYSPDFNPIKLVFAKLKAFFRAFRRRTFAHVCDLMAAALGLFIPGECVNYVRQLRLPLHYMKIENALRSNYRPALPAYCWSVTCSIHLIPGAKVTETC